MEQPRPRARPTARITPVYTSQGVNRMNATKLVCAAMTLCVTMSVWAQNEPPKSSPTVHPYKAQDAQKNKGSQESKKAPEGPPPGMTEEQWKAMQAYSEPGDEHKALYQL